MLTVSRLVEGHPPSPGCETRSAEAALTKIAYGLSTLCEKAADGTLPSLQGHRNRFLGASL